MTKSWTEPEIVSLNVQATMSSIDAHEEYDALYHDILKTEDNPDGYFYKHIICS